MRGDVLTVERCPHLAHLPQRIRKPFSVGGDLPDVLDYGRRFSGPPFRGRRLHPVGEIGQQRDASCTVRADPLAGTGCDHAGHRVERRPLAGRIGLAERCRRQLPVILAERCPVFLLRVALSILCDPLPVE